MGGKRLMVGGASVALGSMVWLSRISASSDYFPDIVVAQLDGDEDGEQGETDDERAARQRVTPTVRGSPDEAVDQQGDGEG
jgi:hypothetical protein